MHRLESLSPDLVAILKRASPPAQRAVAQAAAEFAVRRAKLTVHIVTCILKKVQAAETVTSAEKGELRSLVEQLDREYFDLQEAAEEGRAPANDNAAAARA